MSRPKPKTPEHSAGAFLGPDLLVAAPIRTLDNEYHDTPAEPVDSDRVPEPEPPSLVRRVIDGLADVGRRRRA
jgi:hypothetical protein